LASLGAALRHFTDKRALALTVCWIAALAATGATEALLFLAPALLIAVPLLCGVYVGEELIAKLSTRRGRRRRQRPTPAAPRPATAPTWRPRGARLLAFSLATRPPPAAALTLN